MTTRRAHDPMVEEAMNRGAFHRASELAHHGLAELSRGSCDLASADYTQARKAFRLADLMSPQIDAESARKFAKSDLRSLGARLAVRCKRRSL